MPEFQQSTDQHENNQLQKKNQPQQTQPIKFISIDEILTRYIKSISTLFDFTNHILHLASTNFMQV